MTGKCLNETLKKYLDILQKPQNGLNPQFT